MLLDWAEYKFPDLFPKAVVEKYPAVVYDGVTYSARAYRGAWGARYLGITPEGDIFGLGDFTEGSLQRFDSLSSWASRVLSDQCAVTPGNCGATAPAGALNDCTLPAAQALAPGNRFLATYVTSGSASGQITVDSQVLGATTFEGKSAIQTRTRSETGNSFGGGVSTTTVNESIAYGQDGGNGFMRSLGTESKVVLGGIALPDGSVAGGSTSVFKSVFAPAALNVEFSLQPGQSLKKNTSALSIADGLVLPFTATSATYSFVRREKISVGTRSYSTCRYTEADEAGSTLTTHWFIVNRGVPARTETTSTINGQSSTETTELTQGSFNGVPL